METVLHRCRRICLCAVWLLGVCGVVGSAGAASGEANRPVLRLGVLAMQSPQNTERDYAMVTARLEAALPEHRVQLQPLGWDALELAVQNRQLELVLTNGVQYIGLRAQNSLSGALATQRIHENGVDVATRGAVILRRADRTELAELDKLQGRRLTVALPALHTQGLLSYLGPMAVLSHAGVQTRGWQWIETGRRQTLVAQHVLEGRADLGFVRSGLLEELEREGVLQPGALAVVNPQTHTPYPVRTSTPLYPEWALAALPHVDERTSRQVTAALLSMEDAPRGAHGVRVIGFTIPADYSLLEDDMRLLRLRPFDHAPTVTWQDIWEQHRWTLVWASAAVGGAMLLMLALLRAERARAVMLDNMNRVEARNSAIVSALPDLLFRLNTQGTVLDFQTGHPEDLYLPPHAFLNRRIPDMLPPAVAKRVMAALAQAMDGRSGVVLEYELSLPQGLQRFEMRMVKIADNEVLAIARNVTERFATQEALRLSASVFETSHDGIFITDPALHITSVNPAFTAITGLSPEDVKGLSLVALGMDTQEDSYRDLRRTLEQRGHWKGEIWSRRKNGEVFVELLSVTAVTDAHGHVSHHVGVFSDVSVLKAHEDELQRIASHDTLTGLANRRLLADQMKVAVSRTLRSKQYVAVCYLDLDDFNLLNEAHGHETGDKVLLTVAQRLQTELRAEDTLARLGGDEFVALVNGLADVSECQAMAQRLLNAVLAPIDTGRGTVGITASMGIALYPQDNVNPDTLLRHADQAMCKAKEAGRNRFHVFEAEIDRDGRSRRDLIHRLREALDRQELRLYYQPKVNLRTQTVLGYEALLRWQHPEQGLLPPAAFLSDLLDSDLDIAIGQWVIEEAIRQWCVWHAEGHHAISIGVNVSSHQLLKPGFVEALAATLAAHPGFEPSALQLEILESTAINEIDQAAIVMRECLALGVGFALDDFGTGYSSLSYFRRLPVDTLKVDQSFVRGMLSSQDDRGIVAAVVHLAQAFNRQVVAEGVETLALGEALLELGCDVAQGYAIARPMPAAEVLGWQTRWMQQRAGSMGVVVVSNKKAPEGAL